MPMTFSPTADHQDSNSGIRIFGAVPARPTSQPTVRLTAIHAPKPVVTPAIREDDDVFWVELESTLRAREAARAMHPSSLGARLRLAS